MIAFRYRRRAAFVLSVFLAAVCTTLLAPFVERIDYALVCSVGGSKLVAVQVGRVIDASATDPAHGADHSGDHVAHCPLCMPAGAPPPLALAWDASPVQPLARVRQGIPAARLAGLVGAPLPARGPPVPS